MIDPVTFLFLFLFTDPATTEIYTLSLHDALPIFETLTQEQLDKANAIDPATASAVTYGDMYGGLDRKSTRLNSSHSQISYAVFCLKKKKHSPRTLTLPRARSVDADPRHKPPRLLS